MFYEVKSSDICVRNPIYALKKKKKTSIFEICIGCWFKKYFGKQLKL